MRTKNNKGRFHRIGTLWTPSNLSLGELNIKNSNFPIKLKIHQAKAKNT